MTIRDDSLFVTFSDCTGDLQSDQYNTKEYRERWQAHSWNFCIQIENTRVLHCWTRISTNQLATQTVHHVYNADKDDQRDSTLLIFIVHVTELGSSELAKNKGRPWLYECSLVFNANTSHLLSFLDVQVRHRGCWHPDTLQKQDLSW